MPNITNFPTGRVGIGTENPQQTLDVAGTLRVTGSTGTPNSLMGRNASGDVGVVGIGSGLGIDGFGQLYATGGASGSTSGSGSTNQVAYWTGTNVLSGENNLWWDFSADRLGIGTNAPARSLDVIGGIRFSTVNGTPTTVVGVDASGDIGSVSIGTGLGLSGGVLSFTGSTGGSGTVTGTGTTNYLSKWASASGLTDSIVLETGNTIDINGSLRVRTSSGTATNVMGRDANGYVSNIAVGNGLSVSGGTLSTTGVTFGTGADGRVAYWTGTNQIGNDNNFLWDAETDRLGIGVFPTSALHISSADSASIRIVKTGTSPADFSLVALNGKLDIGSAFTITDTGRLGLGTNAPAQTLDVAGNMRLTGSTGTSATVMGRSVDGDISAISVGSGLSLSGNVLSATGGGGGGVSGSGTATQVAFWNGTTSLTGNTNLYWDNSNNRLGIGTSSPSNQLTTTSDALISTLTIGRGNNSIANNTAIGVSALLNNPSTLASGNTAVGYFALLSTTVGASFNTALGNLTLLNTTSGNSNTAVGSDALLDNTTGNSNTAVGRAALLYNSVGGSNVAVGASALLNNVSGSTNVAVGVSAGRFSVAGTNLTTATSSIFIGGNSRASNISPSNQIVIGTSAVGLADNATVIGTTGTTQTHLYGNLSLGLTSADTTARVKATSSDATSDSFAAKFQNNSGTDILSVRGDGVVGIGTTSPAQTLDIRGTMRLTGSTGTGTTLMGRDGSGDVSAISVGSGLSLSGNTLSTTGTTGVSGSGTATQVAFWGGTSGSTSTALTSSTGLTWDNANGRLGVGINSPTSRLHVVGVGTGSTTTSFLIENNDTVPARLFSVRDDGRIYIGTQTNTQAPYLAGYTGSSEFGASQRTLGIRTQFTSGLRADPGILFGNSVNFDFTSNSSSYFVIRANFAPTSGGGVLNTLTLDNSINQTGGASGTTRGLYFNPTLTSAFDWRSIEWSNNSGYGLYGAGTANNYLAGNTVIGTTTPSARLHVRGSGTTTGTTFLAQASGGTETFRILDNGNVGVNFASPTARLYVKGSTSGNGSTAFEVTDNNDRDIINVRDDGRIALGRNLASNVQSSVTLEAAGGETDINVAIVPKGAGAFTLTIPDNTSTGGNVRGEASVDLQRFRSNSNQVASGNYSVVNGGISNTASAPYSIVNGGVENLASASYSSVIGGTQGVAYLYGQNTLSSGSFNSVGDAQTSNIRLWRSITGSGQTDLFLDGSSQRAILNGTNKVWLANIFVVATVQNIGTNEIATGDTFSGSYIVTIKKKGTTTSLVGTGSGVHTETTASDSSMATSVVTINADDDNDSLRIRFTPPSNFSGTTVTRVVATVYLTEVGF